MSFRSKRYLPRPYQENAVRQVLALYRKGTRKMLLHLPTGSGKTVIAALIIEQLLPLIGKGKILFIAHRRELLDQTVAKIKQQIPKLSVSLEQGKRQADMDAQMIIASIQTLTHRKDLYHPNVFSVIICDECHHALASSWVEVIEYFHEGRDAQALLLGMTATPRRTDGRSALTIFDKVAYEISQPELQDLGYLVPIQYWAVPAKLSLDKVKKSAGDFQVASLTRVMNAPSIRALTMNAWESKGRNKKTLVFCASVLHAHQLCSDCSALGYRAAVIEGRTKNRDEILDRFRKGDLDLLMNYGVLTEGFDDPSIECLLLARPTTSPLVYNQCLGRGLRPAPNKSGITVIDIVDRTTHALQYGAGNFVDLPRNWNSKGRDPFREARAIAQIKVADPQAFLAMKQAQSLEEIQDLLMKLPPDVVFAGLEGEPVVRYQPTNVACDAQEAVQHVRSLLAQAGVTLRKYSMEPFQDGGAGGIFEITFRMPDIENEKYGYLKWHMERATGWKFRYTQPKTPRGRKSNPKALLRSMLPPDHEFENYRYDPERKRIIAKISGLKNEDIEQVRVDFEAASGIELDIQGQLGFGF